MKLNNKIHIENRAEPPALPCCVVRPSSPSSTSSFGPPRRRSALVVVVRPSSSSLGPPPHCLALLLVVRPSSSSSGPRPRRRALLLVVRPSSSSLGPRPPPRRSALRALIWPSPSWAYLRHDGALRVAVEPLALSFGPFASLLGRSRCRLGPPRCCWAAHVIPGLLGEETGLVGGGEREKGEN